MSEAGETLEAIRRTELEAARWVEEARDRSVEIVTGARARGRETARRRLEEAKERSELEADEVRAGGVAEAQGLARHAEERMDMLVDVLVEVVLAPPREKVS
jgi:vacuolar-type H+-ATPase subunit H